MRKVVVTFFTLIFATFVALELPSVRSAPSNPTQKIVTFQQGVDIATQRRLVLEACAIVKRRLKLTNSLVVTIPSPEIEARLRKENAIRYIETDAPVSIPRFSFPKNASLNGDFTCKAKGPNARPWGVKNIGAPSVWRTTRGDGIDVAVLDTGIDLHHPLLDRNVVGGFNAINPGKPSRDVYGHGTHVAGIIGGLNGIGVAPNIRLYAVKVLNDNGWGELSDVLAGLEWAVNNDIEIVNVSLGGGSSSQVEREAVKMAFEAGILIIASAGNHRGFWPASVGFPAAHPEVVAVAATNGKAKIAEFSNTGWEVDVAAPGVDILSSVPGKRCAVYSGTSMAAPHVAGVAALVWSANPQLTNEEVASILRFTADNLGRTGRDPNSGWGRVNATKAVLAAYNIANKKL